MEKNCSPNEAEWTSGSDLYCLNTPAVFTLVPDAGIKGDSVLHRGLQTAAVILTDFGDRSYLVGPGPQPCGQTDRIAYLQCVDLSEVVVDAPVVGGQRSK